MTINFVGGGVVRMPTNNNKRAIGLRGDLSQDVKDAFDDLDQVLDEFSKIERHITLEAFRAFIYAVIHDGENLGSSEMAKRKGIAQNVMSRYMLDLGDRARGGGQGLGLVTTMPFPDNLRSKPVRLTPKGRSLADRMFEAMSKLGRRVSH